MKSAAIFAFLAACLWAAPAQAQMVRAQDPGSLVSALQNAGYPAKLGRDGEGDPMITSKVSGSEFQIFFYNCVENANCATVQFSSGYDLPGTTPLERINDWNRRNRFGGAFVDDEGDPILQMDVDLDDGGMSALLFIDNIEFWDSVLVDFEKFIGYRR